MFYFIAGSCRVIAARTCFIVMHMKRTCNKIKQTIYFILLQVWVMFSKCCQLFYCSIYFVLLNMKPHHYCKKIMRNIG